MRCHLVLHRPPRSLTFLLCVRLFSCLMKDAHPSFVFFLCAPASFAVWFCFLSASPSPTFSCRPLRIVSLLCFFPLLLPSLRYICMPLWNWYGKKKTATAKANRMKLRERERRKEKKRKIRDQLRRVQQWCALLAGRQRNCCTWAPQPTESCPADACRP